MQDVIQQLQRQGLLDDAAAQRAGQLLAQTGRLEESVLAADGVSEDALLRALGQMFGLTCIDLDREAPGKDFIAAFPTALLVRHNILPIRESDGITLVAASTVSDSSGLDALRVVTGRDCRLVLAPGREIDRVLKRLLGVGADTLHTLDAASGIQVVTGDDQTELDADDAAHDASIIRFVNQILTEAIESRATDVHIEPFEDALRLRYRIDGVLQEASVPPNVRRFHAAIVSRLKILAHLDIAEKRLPQDGRIKLKLGGREIDVRVSIIPMVHGEAVVLRLLHRGAALMGTEHLGMAQRDRDLFARVLELPHGIVLVTGPTGSGKTTTLYAALAQINDIQRKIITIEDPVEYQLRGVNHIQVSTKTGLTFAAGLRAILRHDPDVVLIGEIRDRETAEIAVQASLTGHLVFSTLHTNDAPSAATRLVDMGLEPYLVASSLEVVIAQRLVRIICESCKTTRPASEVELARTQYGSVIGDTLYTGAGCRACQGTGFRGRQGVFEMMAVTDDIRSLILKNAAAHEIRAAAMRHGMRSLREDGWRVVAEGRTTVDEVIQNTKDEQNALAGWSTEVKG
jgi:general secretion pathway protein E/type IV pilus assembly protein PilB